MPTGSNALATPKNMQTGGFAHSRLIMDNGIIFKLKPLGSDVTTELLHQCPVWGWACSSSHCKSNKHSNRGGVMGVRVVGKLGMGRMLGLVRIYWDSRVVQGRTTNTMSLFLKYGGQEFFSLRRRIYT